LNNEPEGKVSGNPISKSCNLLKELGTSILGSNARLCYNL